MKNGFANYLKKHEREQLQLLERLVLQRSYSRCKEGVDGVGRIIVESLGDCGMMVEVIEEKTFGNQLIFRSPAHRSGRPSVLLFGHMDTVFPMDSPFNWFKEDTDKVFGPGVIDMKGGLVTAIFAIKALGEQGLLEKIPITLFCNSDEEIGSPVSRRYIRREAASSLFGLGFECGGLNGEVVTGRKGKAGYILEVKGKAGHAAFAGPEKASAILELAEKIIILEHLNDQEKQIVVNVGLIRGGIGPNSVADSAIAEIDTRYLRYADGQRMAERIHAISCQCRVSGTSAVLQKTGARQPMEQTPANKELFQVIAKEAGQLGQDCVEELRSGVSDANIVAEAGIPVVDGMGPIGDCDHSDCEYMIRKSLLARSLLAACTLASGWEFFRT